MGHRDGPWSLAGAAFALVLYCMARGEYLWMRGEVGWGGGGGGRTGSFCSFRSSRSLSLRGCDLRLNTVWFPSFH